MNQKRACLVIILAVIIILPGYASAAQKKPAAMAELALYKGADRQQILEEGARKEGTLTFYTAGILKQAVRPVVDAFEKRYPFLKVDIWRATTMELVSRATTEFRSGRQLMDAIEGQQTNMLVIQGAGIAQPFFSPNFLHLEEEALTKAPGGGAYAAAFRLSGVGLGYNTKLLRKEQLPKTYQDLLDPRWKGKMAIVGSDTGVNWASCIYSNFGEDLLKKIAGQGFVVHVISASALLDMIINGEYAASPTIFNSHVYESKNKGAPVAWVPLEPVRVSLGQIALARNAPHPHAALLFADFELSKESAEIHRGVGYDNFRKDMPALEQHYKKYLGQDSVENVKKDIDIFNRLFVNK